MPWKYTINRNFIILLLCLFPKILHPPSLRASYATVIYKNVLFPKINAFFNKTTFFKKFSEFVTFVILLRISLLEVIAQRCSVKTGFLEICLNSQGQTCARLRPATLLKKRLWQRCFPVNFAKILRTPFFTEQFRWLLLYLHSSVYIY